MLKSRFVVPLLGLFLTSVVAVRGDITLTRDGAPLAHIVANGIDSVAPEFSRARDSRHIRPPALELQHYLRLMTGAELPIVDTLPAAATGPAIILQVVDALPGVSDRDTARQAYRIQADAQAITLSATTHMGLHYAVYGLLEDHLGCRFYSFRKAGLSYGGVGHEVVPRRPTLTLPAIDAQQEPYFANRGIIFWMGSYPWILQNRGIGSPADHTSGALAAGHNMYGLLPPKDAKVRGETIPGLFAEHPDFYPLNQAGVREPTWTYGICGTNPDLPTFLAAGLTRDIEQRQKQMGTNMDWSLPFSAAQGDGFSGCQCPDCRALVQAEQSEAAPLILALNRALDLLVPQYPELRVITFAYFDTLDAPQTLKPHTHLWINVVSSSRSQNPAGDQVGLIDGNPANRDYARALREWPQIAPGRVSVWHWDSYRAEWPSVFYLAPNLRFMRDQGVVGVNPQYCGGPWVDLLAWLYLKLAWNPDADADALIRQFLADNYGAEAAPHVWDYLKLAQRGYEESLHVPSAVRWSGWTPTLSLKLYPPALLAEMTAAMDRALAAAEAHATPEQRGNLRAARGQSLDVMNIQAANTSGRPWGSVRHEADGRLWYVTGADPLVPPALLRARQGIVMDGGGEHGVLRSIAGYNANTGGPLVTLSGPALDAAVCPDLKGQVVSVVDRASGRELLAGQGAEVGYLDIFPRKISAQIWLPVEQLADLNRRANADWSTTWADYQNPTPDRLVCADVLSPSYYGFSPTQHLLRTVVSGDAGLRIERSFVQEKAGQSLPKSFRFDTRWLLALPDPQLGRVFVSGGGVKQSLDLRYAVPGGIRGVKAGDRLPGHDNFDEHFDSVIAVSDAEETRLDLAAEATDDLLLRLDRGDGVTAELRTPAAGWEAVVIKPVVDQHYVEVRLIARPQTLSGEPGTIALAPQTLSARTSPLQTRDAAAVAPVTAAPQPRIRITGPTSAVNEADGAELVWIPAGVFTRGSAPGVGGGDERPQRQVELTGYWIYKHPVTVAQYLSFCEATGTDYKPTWGQAMHAAPAADDATYAVQMNWYEADAYARWAGGALPTEAQWEKAARGADGRRYPWGDTWEPDHCVSMENTVYRFDAGFRPVGSSPAGASPYGVQDMAGGVWEWVADWYAYDAYAHAPDRDPSGPETGTHKVLRGGCALYDERFSSTTARMINPPHVRDWTPTGFRVAIAAPGPKVEAAR